MIATKGLWRHGAASGGVHTASGLFAPSVRVPGAPPAARPLRRSARPARARHAPRPRATAYSVCGRESRVRVPPRAPRGTTVDTPVTPQIPDIRPRRAARAGVDRFTQLMPLFIIEVSNLYLLYHRSWHDQSTPLGA